MGCLLKDIVFLGNIIPSAGGIVPTMRKPVGIGETIKQTRPFASPEVEASLTLMRTAERLEAVIAKPLGVEKLTSVQYNLLRILRGSPQGISTYGVADRLVSRAPNITRLVDKLEAKGLLTRHRSSEDRRVVNLMITPQGLELLSRLEAPILNAVKQAFSGLEDQGDVHQLIDLLNRLRTPLENGDSQ